MRTIQEIKKEINEDFEKGAVVCVADIVNLIDKEVTKGNLEPYSSMKFSNENIENFDTFFDEIVVILLRKGYILAEKDVISDGENVIQVYYFKGRKSSEKYFKNIKKNTGNSAYDDIKTYSELFGREFEDDEKIVNDKLNEINQSIRRTLVSNATSDEDEDITRVALEYDITNEGDKSLEYYCENDEVLNKIVKELKNSGYSCKTELKTGSFSSDYIRLNEVIKRGYHYRELIIEW